LWTEGILSLVMEEAARMPGKNHPKKRVLFRGNFLTHPLARRVFH
jgi:hypothetical protein